RLAEKPCLGGGREVRREGGPRRREETRHGPQIRADRAEPPPTVEAVVSRASQDAIEVDVVTCLLMQTGQAAVGHGLVERLQAGEGVRLVLGGGTEDLEQPPVSSLPGGGKVRSHLFGEGLAQKRVGVELGRRTDGDVDQPQLAQSAQETAPSGLGEISQRRDKGGEIRFFRLT